MEMHFHENSHEIVERLERIEDSLNKVLLYVRSIADKEKLMSAELDALTAQVTRNGDVAASAVALIQGIAAQITANATNPAALRALAQSLQAQDDQLAAAVTANTPAAGGSGSPAGSPAV